ncbi:siderophore biosynthesis protein [Acinetobacter sp. SFD]|jgi:acetyl CoA:N6-hydroxylysine acetyl transferase|uniref:GNAT family N-acetyltransferase n=1 Tax=Acinetobacter sp. SFD TaxID=1805635 RepID=UPI0007D08110|nr:GNAT family N-acetyltransferase [Acinetobacter sp. SFD]OAL85141.1 siderophore biosynthesis protein [Acinetobacter sp. SFD]
MKTLSSSLPDHFNYQEKGIHYALRALSLPDDFALLYKWMHEPHVIPQWQLNKPESELAVYFEKMQVDDHQRLYIIQIAGQDVGYLEIYEARRDRLSLYYPALENDLGWHILLGEKHVVGKGHFRAVMRLMIYFIFENSPAEKIVGEPDENVRSYAYIAQDIAFTAQKKLLMPEKIAVLYHCFREEFYKKCGHISLLETIEG